mgnify:CR=1 FL=1
MAYSDKQKKGIVDFVCNEIAEGKSLRSVLANNDNMPARNTFLEWIENDKNKANQYARAMQLRQESIFEDILNIADNQEEDVLINEDGISVTNHNVIQRARLRVDSRKWMLGKMNPKKYGDKLETENNHSGEIKIVREVKK